MLKTDYCINHPQKHSNGSCLYCGNSICETCIAQHGGPYCCPACKEALTFTPAARPGRKKKKYFCISDLVLALLFKVIPTIAFFVIIGALVFGHFCPQGKEKWTADLSVPSPEPVVILQDLIITKDELSTLTAREAKNGKKAWTLVAPTQGRILSARRIDNESFLYVTENTAYRVGIIQGNFHRHQWETGLARKSSFEIMAADRDNAIIVRNDAQLTAESEIFCLDTNDGTIRWSVKDNTKIEDCKATQSHVLAASKTAADPNMHKLSCLNRITGKVEWSQTLRSSKIKIFAGRETMVVATDRRIVDFNSLAAVKAAYKTAGILDIDANNESIVFLDANGIISFIDRRENKEVWQQYFGPITSKLNIQSGRLYFTASRTSAEKITARASGSVAAQAVIRSPLNLKAARTELIPMLVCVELGSGKVLWIEEHAGGKIKFDTTGNIVLYGDFADFGPLIVEPEGASFILLIDQTTGETLQHRIFTDSEIVDCKGSEDSLFLFITADTQKGEGGKGLKLVAIKRRLLTWRPAAKCATGLIEKVKAKLF